MSEKEQFFTVEIIDYANGRYDEAVEFLVENFKIEARKASALLHRLPKVVTKPVSQTQANKVVQRLATVDIEARLVAQQVVMDHVQDNVQDRPDDVRQQRQQAGFSTTPQADTVEMTTRANFQDLQETDALSTAGSSQGSGGLLGTAVRQTSFDDGDTSRTYFPEMNMANLNNEDASSLDDAIMASEASLDDSFDDAFENDDTLAAPETPVAFSGPPQQPAGNIAFSGPPQIEGASASGPAFSGPPQTGSASSGSTFSGPPATGEVAAEAVGEGVEAPQFGSSQRRRRSSILTKLLLAIIIPSLISIAGIIWGVFFLVSPALREQLFASARQPSQATVRNLQAPLRESSNTVFSDGAANLRDDDRLTAVQQAVAATRDFASGQDILFVAAVDDKGKFISGWFDDPNQMAGNDLNRLFTEMVPQMANLGDEELKETFDDNHGHVVDVLGRNLQGPEGSLGALFVGIDDSSRKQQVNNILWRTLLFLLIPLVLGIALGIWQGRNVTRSIRMLASAADDLSRGNLNADIQVRSNDEIGELADAFERLRTSLRVAFERMRRGKRR